MKKTKKISLRINYKEFRQLFIKTWNAGNADYPEMIIAIDTSDNGLDVRTHSQLCNDWVELANFRGIENNSLTEYDVLNWFDSAWCERKSTDLSDQLCEDVSIEFFN